ncbi:Uncharacterized protein TCM_032267 [Theobroma cacao]|uniref:Uncharacterized protein n=1 Tax=Theobroma cacao TaxID=3641 RepID=A0A061F8H2_THECC|nr:Uncharacterized protein TCM_032267 [Theobroma cacao]
MRLFLLIPSLTKNQSPTNNQPLAMEKKKKVRELQGHLLTVKVVVVVVVGMFLKCLTVKDCLLLWLLKFKAFLELLTCWNGKPLVLLIFIGRSSLKNGQSLIRKKRSQKSNTKATTDLRITVPETANNAIARIEYLDAMRSSINCKLGQAIREIVGFTRDVARFSNLSHLSFTKSKFKFSSAITMSNLTKLEFVTLDITSKNYLSWILDAEIHLDAMGLGDTIKEENKASNQDKAKAMIFLRTIFMKD